MTHPTFSIIMPVYNACRVNPRFLLEAFQSITSQNYRDFELIIVNDGSIDKSEEVCKKFISENPEISAYYYSKEINEGQSSTRNYGAERSTGDYICFIDQDDVWTANKLEIISRYVDKGYALVYTDADLMDQNSITTFEGLHRNSDFVIPHPVFSIEDILFNDIFVMPGLMAIKRDAFFQVGGFDERLSGMEDDDIFLRLYEIGAIKYINQSTLKWRIYNESYGLSSRMLNSRGIYFDKLIDKYANNDIIRKRKISLRFFQVYQNDILRVNKYDAGQFEILCHELQKVVRYLPIRKKIYYSFVFIMPKRIIYFLWPGIVNLQRLLEKVL